MVQQPNPDAAKGDFLTIDVLTDISEAREWTAIELVWLVDSTTEDILKTGIFEWSSDAVTWVSSFRPLSLIAAVWS